MNAHALVEQLVHDLDDGEGFAEGFGEFVGALCGADAFGDLLHGAKDIVEGFALAEAFTDLKVPTLLAIASDDQVADTRKTAEGHGIDVVMVAHADQFGKTATNQERAGIGPITDACDNARSKGHDVFESASEFDADDILASVGAEGGGVEDLHSSGHDFVVAGGDDGGGGMACHDFEGEVGSGDGTDFEAGGFCFEDLAHAEVGSGFNAFGGAEQDLIGLEEVAHLTGGFAEAFGRDHHHDDPARSGILEADGGGDIVRERIILEIALIGVKGTDLLGLFGTPNVESDGEAVAADHMGEGATPASSSDHCDLFAHFGFFSAR